MVEDEGIIALELEDRIRSMGHECMGCRARGEEAVDLARIEPPDVVLMDIGLSGAMDGIETALRLREVADVAIVFLTAYADQAILKRALAARPEGWVGKPFRDADLRAALDSAIRERGARREGRPGDAAPAPRE